MFNISEYSSKLQSRIDQLNERFTELQSNMQLIQQEMKFIEMEIANLDGQSFVIRLVKESETEDNLNKEIILKD